MDHSIPFWPLLVLMAAAANLPFLNERLFLVGPRREPKNFAWRLLEMGVYSGAVLVAGQMIEARQGQPHAQHWPFYAVTLCVLLTMAFPGFAWRYLRRHRTTVHA